MDNLKPPFKNVTLELLLIAAGAVIWLFVCAYLFLPK
jgi:hypothetical protein